MLGFRSGYHRRNLRPDARVSADASAAAAGLPCIAAVGGARERHPRARRDCRGLHECDPAIPAAAGALADPDASRPEGAHPLHHVLDALALFEVGVRADGPDRLPPTAHAGAAQARARPQQEGAGGGVLCVCNARGGRREHPRPVPRSHTAKPPLRFRQVPGQKPAHPLRCDRHAGRCRRLRAQSPRAYTGAHASIGGEVEQHHRRRQVSLPTARMLHVDCAGAWAWVRAIRKPGLHALRRTHRGHAAPRAGGPRSRRGAPRQGVHRVLSRPDLRYDGGPRGGHRPPGRLVELDHAATPLHARRPGRRAPVRLRARRRHGQGVHRPAAASARRILTRPHRTAQPFGRVGVQQRELGDWRGGRQGGRRHAALHRAHARAPRPDHHPARYDQQGAHGEHGDHAGPARARRAGSGCHSPRVVHLAVVRRLALDPR
mmetsp:Transcript_162/g.499  ORF Transcript_162/g.499 Transcript_162/m.499 type:complete len:432 (-) Transcript_162:895-2190(-)